LFCFLLLFFGLFATSARRACSPAALQLQCTFHVDIASAAAATHTAAATHVLQVLLGQGELPILEACRSSKVPTHPHLAHLLARDVWLTWRLVQAVPFGVALSLHGIPKTKM
jgi:hypothetical protein